MNRIPERRRPLVVLAASLAVLLVVAGGVLLIGRLTPTPTPTTLPTSSATASPSADPSTPEGAVRAFFAAFARGEADRRSVDLIRPFVTGDRVVGLPIGRGLPDWARRQSGRRRSSRSSSFGNIGVDDQGDTATFTGLHSEGGYDIDLDTGEPLESPTSAGPARRDESSSDESMVAGWSRATSQCR